MNIALKRNGNDQERLPEKIKLNDHGHNHGSSGIATVACDGSGNMLTMQLTIFQDSSYGGTAVLMNGATMHRKYYKDYMPVDLDKIYQIIFHRNTAEKWSVILEDYSIKHVELSAIDTRNGLIKLQVRREVTQIEYFRDTFPTKPELIMLTDATEDIDKLKEVNEMLTFSNGKLREAFNGAVDRSYDVSPIECKQKLFHAKKSREPLRDLRKPGTNYETNHGISVVDNNVLVGNCRL